jgi:small subunit ribosomal protein S16
MAVKIRLRRTGAKKQPSYRVVIADSRKASDGQFIEIIGHYNPRREPPEVVIKEDRALWWLGRGAQPTDTTRSLLRRAGILQRFDELRRAPATSDA